MFRSRGSGRGEHKTEGGELGVQRSLPPPRRRARRLRCCGQGSRLGPHLQAASGSPAPAPRPLAPPPPIPGAPIPGTPTRAPGAAPTAQTRIPALTTHSGRARSGITFDSAPGVTQTSDARARKLPHCPRPAPTPPPSRRRPEPWRPARPPAPRIRTLVRRLQRPAPSPAPGGRGRPGGPSGLAGIPAGGARWGRVRPPPL